MIVLDSHVVLWLLAEPERIGPASTALLCESQDVSLSAASVWELGIKETLERSASWGISWIGRWRRAFGSSR